eukprot:9558507-Lingulodinium_polyedra.AAC.1
MARANRRLTAQARGWPVLPPGAGGRGAEDRHHPRSGDCPQPARFPQGPRPSRRGPRSRRRCARPQDDV